VLEDLTDQLEVMIWNETFTKSVALLEAGNVVSITGRLDLREEGPRVTANEVRTIKKPAATNGPVVLKFERRDTTEADLVFVRNTLAANPGERRVELVFVGEGGQRLRMTTEAGLTVNFSKELEGHLGRWIQR
ncbi:MAG: OB-fold nucleic acid binding domain-containing protein, partial [Chthoniobacteraceae bacterium]